MPAAVAFLALGIAGFRNHRQTRIEPGRTPFVILTGPNGAGKTNILEALSLFVVGRGLRRAALADLPHKVAPGDAPGDVPKNVEGGGPGGFQLRASLLADAELPPVVLETFLAPPARRRLRVNGAPAALSSLSEWSSQLWLTPAMDGLFADGAGARRRFLDRLALALYPAHGVHASRYQAAMRARNRLLQSERPADPSWLDALEEQMAVHGAALDAARRQTVALLADTIRAEAAGPFPKADLALTAAVQDSADGAADGTDSAALARMLGAARGADRAAGRATIGPHRDDLFVLHAGKGMAAAQSSTGEQKALLLSILLAHRTLVARKTGRVPILLLDEVVAHLDPARRRALFERLAALGGQAWLSGTDDHLFEGLAGARFHVRDGGVEPLS